MGTNPVPSSLPSSYEMRTCRRRRRRSFVAFQGTPADVPPAEAVLPLHLVHSLLRQQEHTVKSRADMRCLAACTWAPMLGVLRPEHGEGSEMVNMFEGVSAVQITERASNA